MIGAVNIKMMSSTSTTSTNGVMLMSESELCVRPWEFVNAIKTYSTTESRRRDRDETTKGTKEHEGTQNRNARKLNRCFFVYLRVLCGFTIGFFSVCSVFCGGNYLSSRTTLSRILAGCGGAGLSMLLRSSRPKSSMRAPNSRIC